MQSQIDPAHAQECSESGLISLLMLASVHVTSATAKQLRYQHGETRRDFGRVKLPLTAMQLSISSRYVSSSIPRLVMGAAPGDRFRVKKSVAAKPPHPQRRDSGWHSAATGNSYSRLCGDRGPALYGVRPAEPGYQLYRKGAGQ